MVPDPILILLKYYLDVKKSPSILVLLISILLLNLMFPSSASAKYVSKKWNVIFNADPTITSDGYNWSGTNDTGRCFTFANPPSDGDYADVYVAYGRSKTYKKWNSNLLFDKSICTNPKDFGITFEGVPDYNGNIHLKYKFFDSSGQQMQGMTSAINTGLILNADYYSSESNFFVGPPKYYFADFVYDGMVNAFGRYPPYDKNGNKRNACLIIWDIAKRIWTARDDAVTQSRVASDIQGGVINSRIRQNIGTWGGSISVALKCSKWVASNLA